MRFNWDMTPLEKNVTTDEHKWDRVFIGCSVKMCDMVLCGSLKITEIELNNDVMAPSEL